MPDLSVVISVAEQTAGEVTESVAASAARAGIDVETLCVGKEVLPLGAAYRRNRGLVRANAEIVAFLDGGFIAEPEWAENLLGVFATSPSAGAVAGAVSRENHSRPTRHGRLRFELFPPSWTAAGVANAAFRRKALLSVGGFEHSLGLQEASLADAEIFLRIVRAGWDVIFAPTVRVSPTADRRPGTPEAWTYVGGAARRRRSPGLPLRAVASPAARGQRLRVVRALVEGAHGDVNDDFVLSLADLMPDEIRAQVQAPLTTLTRSHRAKTHFLYRAGQDRVLHLYANPNERLRRAVAERELIRGRAGVAGIPVLYAADESPDALWLLEELLPGRPPGRDDPGAWFSRVAEWAVQMAGTPGRPLRDVETWQEHERELVAAAPTHLRPRLQQALREVGELRAVHMHGDLQRRNVLVADDRVGAIDWEGAWLEGLPGLDLVFLALYAGSDAPQSDVLSRLLRGGDVEWGGLRDALARVGVDDERIEAALLAMLATWSLAEGRRLSRLGAAPGRAVFRPLLEELVSP